jgi:hypothetical protein
MSPFICLLPEMRPSWQTNNTCHSRTVIPSPIGCETIGFVSMIYLKLS